MQLGSGELDQTSHLPCLFRRAAVGAWRKLLLVHLRWSFKSSGHPSKPKRKEVAPPATYGPSARSTPAHIHLAFAGMEKAGLDGAGEDRMKLPNFGFDNGLDGPYLYFQCVPLHSIVEEEQENDE